MHIRRIPRQSTSKSSAASLAAAAATTAGATAASRQNYQWRRRPRSDRSSPASSRSGTPGGGGGGYSGGGGGGAIRANSTATGGEGAYYGSRDGGEEEDGGGVGGGVDQVGNDGRWLFLSANRRSHSSAEVDAATGASEAVRGGAVSQQQLLLADVVDEGEETPKRKPSEATTTFSERSAAGGRSCWSSTDADFFYATGKETNGGRRGGEGGPRRSAGAGDDDYDDGDDGGPDVEAASVVACKGSTCSDGGLLWATSSSSPNQKHNHYPQQRNQLNTPYQYPCTPAATPGAAGSGGGYRRPSTYIYKAAATAGAAGAGRRRKPSGGPGLQKQSANSSGKGAASFDDHRRRWSSLLALEDDTGPTCSPFSSASASRRCSDRSADDSEQQQQQSASAPQGEKGLACGFRKSSYNEPLLPPAVASSSSSQQPASSSSSSQRRAPPRRCFSTAERQLHPQHQQLVAPLRTQPSQANLASSRSAGASGVAGASLLLSAGDANIRLMDYRSRMRPVQLFGPSSSNPHQLKLNKSGLNAVFGHASLANRKIVVISITGAYRKGKSFLLNFFLEYLWIVQFAQKRDEEVESWLNDETLVDDYFHYKAGPKRNTVGIWIWPEPLLIDVPSGERYAVVLLDVQGCVEQGPSLSGTGGGGRERRTSASASPHDPNNNNNNSASAADQHGQHHHHPHQQQHTSSHQYVAAAAAAAAQTKALNRAVFWLSTLLSSVQCYNFAESVPDEALQLLSFFNDYRKLASVEASDLGLPFQKLALIVRDYKITDNEIIYGMEGGSRFLERLLLGPPDGVEDESLHEIRACIRTCFSIGVSCYLIPHPGMKVVDSGFRGLAKDIRPAFREEVARLVESMVHPKVLQPKMLNGRPVTVRKFVECVREYAKIFAQLDNLPEPRTLMSVNVQLACAEYAVEAKVAYCKAMDRTTRTSRMVSEKRLLEAHIKHGVKALNIYDRCPKVGAGNIRGRQLERLQESINKELEHYQRLNAEKRVTTCASAMLACGDSPLLGLGLGGAAGGAVAGAVFALQVGAVSAGVIAIPASLVTIFGIWAYVTAKPCVRRWLRLRPAADDPDHDEK